MVSVKVKGVDAICKKLEKVGTADLKPAMEQATAKVTGAAKALCPVDTGGLKTSIHGEVKTSEKGIVGEVSTQKEYAPYVEFGTGPVGNGTYPYDVKNLNLSYKDEKWTYKDKDGNFHTTKGHPAQPFMYPALANNKDYINKLMKKHLTEICKKAVSGG